MSVEIFDIKEKRITVNPSVLLIPELRAVYDTYDSKIEALSYVAFMTDRTLKNPYGNIVEDVRREVLMKDLPGDYRFTDEVICKAIEKMELLNNTVINQYYTSLRNLLKKLGDYADTVILDDSRDGNLASVLKMVKEIGQVAKNFREAEKIKEEEEQKGRGNRSQAYDL